jgi:hypothetical protein
MSAGPFSGHLCLHCCLAVKAQHVSTLTHCTLGGRPAWHCFHLNAGCQTSDYMFKQQPPSPRVQPATSHQTPAASLSTSRLCGSAHLSIAVSAYECPALHVAVRSTMLQLQLGCVVAHPAQHRTALDKCTCRHVAKHTWPQQQLPCQGTSSLTFVYDGCMTYGQWQGCVSSNKLKRTMLVKLPQAACAPLACALPSFTAKQKQAVRLSYPTSNIQHN